MSPKRNRRSIIELETAKNRGHGNREGGIENTVISHRRHFSHAAPRSDMLMNARDERLDKRGSYNDSMHTAVGVGALANRFNFSNDLHLPNASRGRAGSSR